MNIEHFYSLMICYFVLTCAKQTIANKQVEKIAQSGADFSYIFPGTI
jgi:hypothetical protein